jgi:hypothetical protein
MPEDQEQPQWNYVRDAEYRSVYANNTVFASTAFDFAMIFGEITNVDPDKAHITAEQRVKVIMSPLHFKIFASVCIQNVKQYEERFGVIELGEGSSGGVVAGNPVSHVTGTFPNP